MVDCFSLFWSFLLLRFCFVLQFGIYSYISLFCLFLWIFFFFYILGRSTLLPNIKEVVSCRRYLMGPGDTISLATKTRCSRGVIFECCVHPPAVVWAWLLRVSWWWGWPLGYLSVVTGYDCCRSSGMWEMSPQIGSHFGGTLVLAGAAFYRCQIWSHLAGVFEGNEVGWGGITGEHWSRANGISQVNGECQNCHIPEPGQLGERRIK